MNTHAVSFALMVLLGVQQAAAAQPLDRSYGANIRLENFNSHEYEDQFAISQTLTTANALGGTLTTEASATVPGMVEAKAVGNDRDGFAYAEARDTLTFHVASSGSVLVPFRMTGTWTVFGGPADHVTYFLTVGPEYYVGGADTTHSTSSHNNAFVPSAFSGDGTSGAGSIGSYEVNGLLQVWDGGVYTLDRIVRADVGGLSNHAALDYAFIDDPFTIAPSAGVTFTSASGATYAVAAVPEPSTWLLMAAGFAGVGWLRRFRRRDL